MAEKVPLMNWETSNTAESFKFFKQKLQIYFQIKEIEGERQVPYILRAVDDEGLRRYNSWKLTEEQQKQPEEIWKRFEEQLKVSSENFRVARLQLHYYYQKPDETLDDFVTRCRVKAHKCDFTDEELGERIIEQIIASTPIPDYQKYLLEKEKGFKLEEALKQGRLHEATISNKQQIKTIRNGGENTSGDTEKQEIHAINKKSSNYRSSCKNCGGDHARNREACPAQNSVCRACNKTGHWQKCCLTTKFKERGQSKSPARGRSRNKRYKSRDRRNNGNTRDEESKNRQVHSVHRARVTQHQDEFEEDFFNIQVSTLCNEHIDNRDEAYAKIEMNLDRGERIKSSLRLKVDTGAEGNTLPLRTYRRIFPRSLDLEGFPTDLQSIKNVKLTAYNGSEIKCYGSTSIPCRYNNQEWKPTKFYVVDVPGPAVIGLSSSQKLGLVTLHCSIETQHQASQPETEQVINSVEDLKKLFPEQFDRIGNFPGEAKIHLKEDAQPYIDPPRKWPIHLKDKLKAELDKMESQEVIKKVEQHTDWCSSLTVSTKSDGSLRVCLDPAKLNQSVKRCPHKIPTLEELNHKFRGSKYFSKLDAKAGYWSVHLEEESQLLTTFRTPFGRYCFRRLPFGLSTSQDIFQQRMDSIIEQCEGVEGIADDLVVHGRTEEEHDRRLLNLMRVAKKNGLVFNSIKCFIKKPRISFFGMTYGREGIKPDPKKVEDLQAMPTPTSKKELQEFLGLIQYLSPFIDNLADKAAELRDLLKKDVPFQWEKDHEHRFKTLKQIISQDASLQYYDINSPVELMVDASQRGLGAALLQPDEDGKYKPIAYASKSLSPTQSRYANIERELLAVCFGVERFNTYLYNREFKVISDHKPLVMITKKNITAAPPRLQRMLLRLQGYKFTIEHRPGKDVGLVDSLSRLPNPSKNEDIELDCRVDLIYFKPQKLEEIRRETKANPDLQQLEEIIREGWPANVKDLPARIREFWTYRDEMSIEDGVILKGERVLIPETVRKDILQQLHTGHMGVVKTKLRAKNSVYWPRINADIEKICGECGICEEYQTQQQKETMIPHEIPTRPWETLGTDLYSIDQVQYLIIADYYSKYPIVRKLPATAPSSTVARATKQVFAEHGVPSKVVSDNGPHFEGKAYTELMANLGIKHVHSSPRYPQSNGFIERTIRTVKNIIKKCTTAGEDIETALMELRATPIDAKLKSPAELLFGRKIRTTLPVRIRNESADREKVHSRLLERQAKQKSYFDRNAKDLPELQPGENVTVLDLNSSRWVPAVVIRKGSDNEARSYIIRLENGRFLRRNRRHLRRSQSERRVTFAEPIVTSSTLIHHGDEDDIPMEKPQPRATPTEEPHLRGRTTDVPQPTREQPRRETDGNQYRTRSGRVVRKPSRYGDN